MRITIGKLVIRFSVHVRRPLPREERFDEFDLAEFARTGKYNGSP